MSNEEAVDLAETEVSDEKFDEFFEKEGEVELAEPEPEKQEEAEAQPEPEQQEEQQERDKFVPHAALHEERMRRKEIQQQLEENQAKIQKMEETFQKLQERAQQDQAPKYDEDPIEYLRHENEQLKQRIQHYDQRFTQSDQQAEQYRQQQEFVNRYQQQAAEYAQKAPDFQDAYKYLLESRTRELQAAGYAQQEAAQVLTQEEAMIVAKAFEDGVNPAERVHALAKARGYQAKEPEKPNEEQKMETLEKGMEASKSLSSGGSAKGEMTLESLADLDDEEFDKVWSKMIGGE